MAKERVLNRKQVEKLEKARKDRVDRPANRTWDAQSGVASLQPLIGNRATSGMLALAREQEEASRGQQEAEDTGETSKEIPESGEIKVEEPEVEYYDVSGTSLEEVVEQLKPEDEWREYEYIYEPTVEDGVVTETDITVEITIHVPRWTGPGWDNALAGDKVEWMRILQSLDTKEDKHEEVTKLPPHWLGIEFDKAPDRVKGEIKALYQAMQVREEGIVDLARRRALVLQQRLLDQPESQIKAIFDRFLKDLEVELEAYEHQEELGKKQKISLADNVMLK